jgi:endo-1,4-beta-xylanase
MRTSQLVKRCHSITALVLVLLSTSDIFAQPAAPPANWLEPDKSEPAGTHYRTFSSALAGSDVSYLIYLPPTYESQPAARFPVVYWLHGLGGNPLRGAAFVQQLDAAIRAERAPAMIAVLVNGMRDSFYCDSKDGQWPIESVIIKELIPHIDKTYRTFARREMRGVEGYSMGGYGAAHLGFKYPDVFGIVGIMAGALFDFDAPGGRSNVFEKMFGSDKDYAKANNPSKLVRQNADAIRGRTTIRIAVGDQDQLQPRNQALHELLDQLKIPHEYTIVAGVGHNNALFYKTQGPSAFAYLQKTVSGPPVAANWPNASVPSHVFPRGDVEILSFDDEETYDRLESLYRETRDTQPPPGVMTPLYFRSKLDGSVIPYAIRLPGGYSRERKYPLVLQLHGTNFKEVLTGSRLSYRGMGGPQWIHPELQVIYVHCFGGPTTFYIGMGEEEILAVIEDAQRRFPVDPDRLYIMGHSMGGAGSYMVGLHYPDHFGGISVGDAAMGFRGRPGTPPPPVPDWMAPQVAIHTPVKLYPNARNVDVFFKNAGAGIQRNSTEFADGIVAEGGFATTEVFPGMPHSFGDRYPYANFVTEVTAHPIKRRPSTVKFYTNTLRYNGAYWVTIDRLTRHNADARIEVEASDDAIRVTTANIDALSLRLAEAPVSKQKPLALVVDGREVAKGPLDDVVHLSKQSGQWALGQWKADGIVKRHGLQGPIGDAFNARFLAVYGEGDGDKDLAIAELDAIRNAPGPLDIQGDFPMKPAARVTSDDIASANLILFGTPETNAVLRRIAPALPPELVRERAIFIYPNPESPEHTVVVWNAKLLSTPDHGVNSGWIMPLNLLPDYVVVKDGQVASGGHFDNQWKLP